VTIPTQRTSRDPEAVIAPSSGSSFELILPDELLVRSGVEQSPNTSSTRSTIVEPKSLCRASDVPGHENQLAIDGARRPSARRLRDRHG